MNSCQHVPEAKLCKNWVQIVKNFDRKRASQSSEEDQSLRIVVDFEFPNRRDSMCQQHIRNSFRLMNILLRWSWIRRRLEESSILTKMIRWILIPNRSYLDTVCEVNILLRSCVDVSSCRPYLYQHIFQFFLSSHRANYSTWPRLLIA